MAPRSSRTARTDDFILTISDNEDEIPNLDGDDFDQPAGSSSSSKKRKREEKEPANKQKSKKPRKGQSTSQNGTGPKLQEESDAEDEDLAWADQGEDDGAMDSDFEFQIGDADNGVLEDFDGWGLGAGKAVEKAGGDKKGVDIDEIIARRRQTNGKVNGTNAQEGLDNEEEKEQDFDGFGDDDELLAADGFGMGAVSDDEDIKGDTVLEEEASQYGAQHSDGSSDEESVAEGVPHPDDMIFEASSEDEQEDPAEAKRRAAFFAPEENLDGSKPSASRTSGSFQTMGLDRPIHRGLAAVGFTEPTPIQAKTIPIALLGKDVVGGAVTGSGKTAAFMIPILQRLLYRPKKVPTTRVAILMPTRELAVQCFNVARKLASFTDITFAQIVGGYSLREQENVLKTRPDVVIATPGRFIDHMRNSPSFAVDTLEILVLDEADRMLEDGFADELNEILTTIPKSRQTMLFSATMTDTVDKLIRVGLNRPARLMVDAKKSTVSGLVQEFVRLRPGKEDKRLAYLLYLCQKVYTDRVIIFFRQKKEAHRVRVIFGLCGLKAAELHGSMSQEQRITAVESFRSFQSSFLLATDLASRGLDIKNISTVLNYSAPQSHEIYLHRVGRTARAGRSGRACTLAAEPDRKVVKAAVKAARAQGAKIVSRTIPNEDGEAWAKRLEDLEEEIEEVLREEKEERLLQGVERDVRKGENLVTHEDEIKARPRRTWFESEKEKAAAKDAGSRELNGEVDGVLKKGKKKLSGKEKKKLELGDLRKEGKIWKKGKGDEKPKVGKSREMSNGKDGAMKGGAVKGGAVKGGVMRGGRGGSRGKGRR